MGCGRSSKASDPGDAKINKPGLKQIDGQSDPIMKLNQEVYTALNALIHAKDNFLSTTEVINLEKATIRKALLALVFAVSASTNDGNIIGFVKTQEEFPFIVFDEKSVNNRFHSEVTSFEEYTK